MRFLALSWLAASLAVACGSGGPAPLTDAGAPSDAQADAITRDAQRDDASTPADAPFACGKATCGVTQYCVMPCCGGAGPRCEPKGDASSCPPGTHDANCGGFSGCESDPCVPPPAYCTDDAAPPPGCQRDGNTRGFVCQCG